ncbi:response regulator [Duganella sp. BJB488]|uniref:hybrid sensor histidine kinase/response regulator n=1 Tax=unclassified Duganella TaxID=2636909 RepID=UPI000E3507F2|nr:MULTISPECIES: ATP-binding protein [unclassified Duganella]RFP12218.1 response regulator [Duganella sp. BJB488]RFP20136.1 response regulator [Duganella sp. BJB489]RFP33557.1 response regulator [Duganella sp. BJB480]
MSELVPRSRIVVVDDQAAHLKALCDILGQHQLDAVGFPTGETALAHLRGHACDLLLTDMNMPGMDGLALIEAAKALDPAIACIIMTGAGTVDTAVKAMKIGAFDYIIKPFKAATLLPVLTRALESRRLRLHNLQLEAALRERVDELGRLNQVLDAARREAERTNEEKSAFLSNMSHELRTPLNSILGFAQILASDRFPKGEGERQRFSQNIVSSGKHLLSLVNEILDLSKIEAGKVSLVLGPVMLDEVLREVVAIVAPLAERRMVALMTPADCRLELCADRMRLKQVLVNLFSNAIKYNHVHGSVTVHCAVGPGYGSIAVSDSGVGLDAAQLETIFLPFGRAGRDEEGEEGTGLGLTITRRLVEAMRGRISVESKPGEGSTFRIELPLHSAAAAPAGVRGATQHVG